MWSQVLDYTLKFFEDITGWVSFLFTDYALYLDHPNNEFFNWLVGWFIDWVNNWGLVFKPIEMIGIETFLVFFVIFLFKMIF